jgi:hypothetical protein
VKGDIEVITRAAHGKLLLLYVETESQSTLLKEEILPIINIWAKANAICSNWHNAPLIPLALRKNYELTTVW